MMFEMFQKENTGQGIPAWQNWLTFPASAASPVGGRYRHIHHLEIEDISLKTSPGKKSHLSTSSSTR